MFDWYQPKPSIICQKCKKKMELFQGKDGLNCLLLWEQGRLSPVDQMVEKESKLSAVELEKFRLPKYFQIYERCSCGHHIVTDCFCENEIWNRIELKEK